jgi:hypothetical protein
MAGWAEGELDRVGAAQELRLQSERRDGTLRDPVTMCVVREGNGVYVCSVRGRDGAWFRGTQTRHQGRIHAGGTTKDIRFEDADPGVLVAVEAGFRTKYAAYSGIVERALTPQARAATLKLVPR